MGVLVGVGVVGVLVVGASVGAADGDLVGARERKVVGTCEGVVVGEFEGVTVGTCEGTVVGVELKGATVDSLFPPVPLPPT